MLTDLDERPLRDNLSKTEVDELHLEFGYDVTIEAVERNCSLFKFDAINAEYDIEKQSITFLMRLDPSRVPGRALHSLRRPTCHPCELPAP